MTHIKRLTHRPHNPHGLRLLREDTEKKCVYVYVCVCVCVRVEVLRAGVGEAAAGAQQGRMQK